MVEWYCVITNGELDMKELAMCHCQGMTRTVGERPWTSSPFPRVPRLPKFKTRLNRDPAYPRWAGNLRDKYTLFSATEIWGLIFTAV